MTWLCTSTSADILKRKKKKEGKGTQRPLCLLIQVPQLCSCADCIRFSSGSTQHHKRILWLAILSVSESTVKKCVMAAYNKFPHITPDPRKCLCCTITSIDHLVYKQQVSWFLPHTSVFPPWNNRRAFMCGNRAIIYPVLYIFHAILSYIALATICISWCTVLSGVVYR